MFSRLLSIHHTACLTDRALALRSERLALIFGALALGAAILYTDLINDIEPIKSDSIKYIEFSLDVPVGYPAFLAMLRMAGFGFGAIGIIQLILFCGTTWFLATETAAITRSALAGAFVLIGILSGFELIKYCFMILTESLAISFSLLLLALLARFCRRPHVLTLTAMSTVVGLAMLVRPAFAPLFVVPMLPLLSLGWPPITRIGALVAPVAACVLVGSLAQYFLHGCFCTQSSLGSNLIGEAGKFATGKITTQLPQIIDPLRDPAEAIQRQRNLFSDFAYRFLVSVPYHDYLADRVWPIAEEVAARAGKRADDIALDAAIDIIRAHPIDYFANAVLNLYGLWFIPNLMTQREVDAFIAELAIAEPIPFIGGLSNDVRARPKVIVFAGRTLLLLALAACIIAPAIWIIRSLTRFPLDPTLVGAAAASAGVHSVFLVTALVQTGFPRYALVMWPAMAFTIALLAIALSRREFDLQ